VLQKFPDKKTALLRKTEEQSLILVIVDSAITASQL
jgi:hypothetical protein